MKSQIFDLIRLDIELIIEFPKLYNKLFKKIEPLQTEKWDSLSEFTCSQVENHGLYSFKI